MAGNLTGLSGLNAIKMNPKSLFNNWKSLWARQPVGDSYVHSACATRLVADHAILSEQNCDRMVICA
jgi:hypothetical protein